MNERMYNKSHMTNTQPICMRTLYARQDAPMNPRRQPPRFLSPPPPRNATARQNAYPYDPITRQPLPTQRFFETPNPTTYNKVKDYAK